MTYILLQSDEIRQLEAKFLSLFERTLKNGLNGKQISQFLASVKKRFQSSTFRVQIDKIIDSIFLTAYSHVHPNEKPPQIDKKTSNMSLTIEAVRLATSEAQNIVNAIILSIQKSTVIRPLKQSVDSAWLKLKSRVSSFTQLIVGTTAMNAAINLFREDGVKYFEFRAIIDERTSHYCRLLNGSIWSADSSGIVYPPIHNFCRSQLISHYERVKKSELFSSRNFSSDEKDILKQINIFKEKYTISQDILTLDYAKRILYLKS